MSFKNFDFNLLKVLDVLITESNVTRAGEQLGRSQPAISNALRRLRVLLNDDLLVRGVKGVVLTPRAEAIRQPLREALEWLEGGIFEEVAFDPTVATGVYRLSMPDRLTLAVVPPLLDRLRRLAPNMALQVLTADRQQALDLLDTDRIDLALATGDGHISLLQSLFDLLRQSALGIIAGLTLGYLASLLIAHERWAFLAEYAPVVTLVAVIAAYFAASDLQASGFMAVFVFGIVLGNQETFGFQMHAGEAQKLAEFVLTTSFIMRLFIFILLGAQVDFAEVGRHWLGAVAVVTVLMLVARPITVFLCALPDRRARWRLPELLFMCWTRETGVIPAALAGLLLSSQAPGAHVIASVTFVAILMTILIQAPTTEWVARKLGLLESG